MSPHPNPHPEERSARRRGARLEGWRQAPCPRPSFETLAALAPQDEGCAENETAGLLSRAGGFKNTHFPRPCRGVDDRLPLRLMHARGFVLLQAGDLVLHMQLAT